MTNTNKQVRGFSMSGEQESSVSVDAAGSLVCPYCHIDIEMQPIDYLRLSSDEIRIFLKCKSCREAFIGHYGRKSMNGVYYLLKLIGGNPKMTEFSDKINEISPSFVKIYNQSELAESQNLEEISGIGYRKSLEFIIKDFLLHRMPEKSEKIKKSFLGNCIKENIDNKRIKDIAEKATWLGNDEAHYSRVWGDKDVSDLKKMIEIIVNYVDMELSTDSYLEEMVKPLES